MREYRIDHLPDELLLSFGRAAHLFELPLQVRCWAALARLAWFAEEFLDAGSQGIGQQRQAGYGNAPASDLEQRDLLLGEADQFEQLGLNEILALVALADAGAELTEKAVSSTILHNHAKPIRHPTLFVRIRS